MSKTHGATVAGFGFVFKDTEFFALVVFDNLVFNYSVFDQRLADFYFILID